MKYLFVLFALASLFLATGCSSWPGYGQARFTSVNVHARIQSHRQYGRVTGAYLLSSHLGYVGEDERHVVIPINTEVKAQPWEEGFVLVAPKLKKTIRFQYNPAHMKMSVTDYITLITSTGTVALGRFSEVDRKGIKEGRVYPGMSRTGVRLAWGEPSRHATPFLDMPKWVYWRTRFKKAAVIFNKDGKVSSVR